MATRMTQEMQGIEGGVRTVLVRIPLDQGAGSHGGIEVTAVVKVPAIESDAQIEVAAREMARRALEQALELFP